MASRFAAAFLLALLALAAQPKKDDARDALKLTKEEQELIDLTNAQRKVARLTPAAPSPGPLAVNPKLMAAARGHAANMAKQDKLDHILDDKDFAARAKEAGYKYAPRRREHRLEQGRRPRRSSRAGWTPNRTGRTS